MEIVDTLFPTNLDRVNDPPMENLGHIEELTTAKPIATTCTIQKKKVLGTNGILLEKNQDYSWRLPGTPFLYVQCMLKNRSLLLQMEDSKPRTPKKKKKEGNIPSYFYSLLMIGTSDKKIKFES